MFKANCAERGSEKLDIFHSAFRVSRFGNWTIRKFRLNPVIEFRDIVIVANLRSKHAAFLP